MRQLLLSSFSLLLITPLLAQGLPAIAGQGSQSQSVDLAKEAVSVTLDTGGALAAGAGGASGSGSAGVTVNDLSIEFGADHPKQPAGAGAPAGSSAVDMTGNTLEPGREAKGAISRPAITPDGISSSGSSAESACDGVPDPRALARALFASRLLVRESSCVHGPAAITALIASQPALQARLSAVSIRPEAVVAITFTDHSVTIWLARGQQLPDAKQINSALDH